MEDEETTVESPKLEVGAGTTVEADNKTETATEDGTTEKTEDILPSGTVTDVEISDLDGKIVKCV